MFTPTDELKIGQVVEVSGTTIKVEISNKVSELTRTFDGRVYPIGQIGSMVKIHYGRKVIFGLVTMLRMRSEELLEAGMPINTDSDQRLMEVQLLAEGSWNNSSSQLSFKRGIKTYPLPQQGVFLLTNDEISCVYRSAEGEREEKVDPLVPFAVYSASESTACRANINKMFGMHCAVLGSTGSGKSGTVAAIIHSVLEHNIGEMVFSPQIVVIDPHGEYGAAFSKRAIQYRAYDIAAGEDQQELIKLPYWLMSSDEFTSLIVGKTEESATSQNNIVQKALTHARMVAAGIVQPCPREFGTEVLKELENHDDPNLCDKKDTSEILEFDRDKPRPFCLDEFESHIRFIQGGRFKKGTKTLETLPPTDLGKARIPSVLDKVRVLRRDKRLSFMLQCWEGEQDEIRLHNVLNQLVGVPVEDKKDIRIIDISGLPNEVAGPLAALIARLLFQYKVFQTQEEKEKDPILLVCEEAHRYVPDHGEAQYAAAQGAIRRIAREGRKYGVGLMLVSQRPADVDSTVISQCGTWVVLRLTNSADQQHVARFLPDGLSGMVGALPILSQQEAIFVGEGAALPSRIRVRDLSKEQLPKSNTIPFAEGWANGRLKLDELEAIAERMCS
ncbi:MULTISPECIES: ATP-binding protein [Vibrio harveyi group]|uniref:ATP-binding protein n=1 Tax=Vibrio harveyi group TaxID=717610 RepID=UPI001A2012BF|nr:MULTISPECIES: ATP-binding protein [Vibrio harveyi group]EHH1078951.1 ATP-binding protein [Vibrio parahaemolyticus]EJV0275574.1 ATP-binding protein [Vibrio parahaemolyticus]ELB2007133.1 ATP-binding protein [Vibrio parahaemolyticus]MCG6459690.1 ATP-binding protein [Vibrio parahaemolyticus]MCS0347208.1 ATP-binding protein [Vibrio diabolicus]